MTISALRAWHGRRRQRFATIRPWSDLTEESHFRDATVAIVGNAGYLTEMDQGELIDSHDVVLRMNNFRTTGFERHVGRKTTIFLTNFWIDIDFASEDCRTAEFVVSSSPNNFKSARSRGVALRHGPLITAGLRNMHRYEAFVPSIDWFAEQIARIGRYPTTGAVALMLAVDVLLPIAKSVYVTGFSFFEGRNHYFSDRGKDLGNHNIDREKQIIFELLTEHVSTGRVALDPSLSDRFASIAAAA